MVTFRLGVHALLPGLRGTNSCHVPTLRTQSTQVSLSARAQSQDLVLGYWHCARILGILLDLVPSVSIAYAVADLEQKSEGAQEEEKAAGQATKKKNNNNNKGLDLSLLLILLLTWLAYLYSVKIVMSG